MVGYRYILIYFGIEKMKKVETFIDFRKNQNGATLRACFKLHALLSKNDEIVTVFDVGHHSSDVFPFSFNSKDILMVIMMDAICGDEQLRHKKATEAREILFLKETI